MMRLAKWGKGVAEWFDDADDVVNLSVVFSWQVDEALDRAQFWGMSGRRVRVGGPGVFVRRKEFDGLAEVGNDFPEAVTRHNPMATFASRGCPVGCWFCIVPAMEGRKFTLIEDFVPRPILCDNNLSALPEDYQRHIVKRYESAGVRLGDANSGFEPAKFTEDTFAIWRPVNAGPWRLAFDEQEEAEDVRSTVEILTRGGVDSRKIRVYVLIGNEPFDSCMDRINSVIGWGAEPHVQPVIKLNATHKEPWVRFDWTTEKLKAVARWANRRLWKYTDFDGYSVSTRTKPPMLDQMTIDWPHAAT